MEEGGGTYVKSPVASLCFTCSSVRNRVRVTMLVLTFSVSSWPLPFVVTMVARVWASVYLSYRAVDEDNWSFSGGYRQ